MSDQPNAPRTPYEFTPARMEAQRKASAHATGPRTPEGKAIASRNHLKHGRYIGERQRKDQRAAELMIDRMEIEGHAGHDQVDGGVRQDAAADMDQDARVERIHRMPVKEDSKPLTPSEQRQAVVNIKSYVESRKLLSVTALGRMAGLSSSVVSEVLKGKYRGDIDAVLRKLDAAVADHARREGAPAGGQFVRTAFAQRIFAILKLATKRGTMAAVYCVSGTGKTMALRAALQLDFPHALYLEVNPGCASPLRFCQALIRLLYGGRVSAESVRDRGKAFNLIVEKLANSRRMIMIDEADGLPPDSLNILRQIHDATGTEETRCPIVLAGRPNLRTSIDKTMRCPEIGGSLRGRIGIEHNLMPSGGTNPADGGSWLFSVEEIQAMLSKRRIQITRDAARWLCALANISLMTGGLERGGPRIAIQVALNAATLNKSGGAVDRDMLLRSFRLAVDPEGANTMEHIIDESLRYNATAATA